MINNSKMIIYTTEDGLVKIETTFNSETVWLSLDQMSSLFQRDKSTISRHIKNIYEEGELVREATVANFATVQNEGERQTEQEQVMTMEDWVKHLDNILTVTGEQLLVGNGSISHQKAMEKAESEYKKYKTKTLSDVERDYLDVIKELENLK